MKSKGEYSSLRATRSNPDWRALALDCRVAVLLATTGLAMPAIARDSLGIYQSWGAFRDSQPSRCYAIAEPEEATGAGAFATVSWWPDKNIRGQFHARLSSKIRPTSSVYLDAGGRRWRLTKGEREAWSPSGKHDSFILAKLRSAGSFVISVESGGERTYRDYYTLRGAPSAFDAAALGCAKGR